MTVLLYSALIAFNIILVMLRKNSKIALLLTMAGQALLMCGNNMNADYSGYLYFYKNQNYASSMEPGYVWLSKLAFGLGLDYQTFTMILLLITIVILYILTFSLSDNAHLVSLLYLSTMMFLDVVQVRQFVAYIIMAYALLLYSKGKRILYCLLILFGSLFQITILVYLPLLFLNIKRVSSKRFIKVFFAGILLVCILVFVSGSRLELIGNLMSRVIDADKMIYFQTRTRYGFLKYFAFQFLCIYIAWIVQQYYLKKDVDQNKKNYVNAMYICILYSSVAMPLVMLNNNFYRFFKFGLIPLFICLSYLMIDTRLADRDSIDSKIPLTKRCVGSTNFYVVICIVLIFGFSLLMQSSSVVTEVLENNMFLTQ